MSDNNAGSMTIVDGKFLHDEWCHWVIEGTACSCHVAVVKQLEAENAALKGENEKLERSNERAWDSARFFAGRNELLRLHIRCHLGLVQMECIGWSDENYRDALLAGEGLEDVACAKCGELIDGCECEDGFFFTAKEQADA